jgi:hypothetical protein
VKQLALLAAFVIFGVLNFLVPVLRFTSPVANLAAGCVLLILPAVLAPILILRLGIRPLLKALAVVGVAPFVLLALFLALLTGSCLQHARATGVDPSFDPLVVQPIDGSQVTAYRTNGGAMGDISILVRQEKRILPGLLLVRNVFGQYHAREATLQSAGPRAVEVRANGTVTVLQLRRFVYF